MERVEHRDSVGQLVIDGVLVAVERVQGGDLDALAECVAAVTKPGLVGLPGAARDQIEESGPDASVLIAGEIDHAGELLRAASALVDGAGGDVMPDVLVDAKRGDAGEAGLVVGGGFEHRSYRPPQGFPGAAELAGQSLDRGVLPPHLPDRPQCRAAGEQRPRPCDLRVLFHERGHWTLECSR
jgi:hypothetical protein